MSPKIYRAFFFLGGTSDGYQSGYPHPAVVLAEGLRGLGWEISSDVKVWQVQPQSDFLFPGDGQGEAEGADLIVMTGNRLPLHQVNQLLPEFTHLKTKPLIYLDDSDLGRTTRQIYDPTFRRFDAICRCHSSRYFSYPTNVRPWVFGISDRIREACADCSREARKGILWNFRKPRYAHTVRQWAEREVKPVLSERFEIEELTNAAYESQEDQYDDLMRIQTGGRHARAHYRNLGCTLICACFGGFFLLPKKQEEGGRLCLLVRKLLTATRWRTMAIAQWDSWRLWEAFAAGAVVLHVDFEKHGFLLPGPLPKPMTHYVAVDVNNPAGSLKPILEDTNRLREIAASGRAWALEHYSSVPIARRLISSLMSVEPAPAFQLA